MVSFIRPTEANASKKCLEGSHKAKSQYDQLLMTDTHAFNTMIDWCPYAVYYHTSLFSSGLQSSFTGIPFISGLVIRATYQIF